LQGEISRMSAHPFFSILVPTYNQAQYVGAALDSLLAQTDADWEAVVVNDGSTDNTAEVLNRYSQRDPRIRVVHKPNGGTGSALNRALSEASGDWICWLSSDDFFDPKKLAIHRAWIKRDPRCRFHFTYFRLFNQAAGTTVDHQLWGPLPEREFQVLGLFYRNYVSGISICVNRESWEKVGRFNEGLRYAQDYDMWLRLLARYPAAFIPEWTCISRQHSGQGSEVFQQACYYDTAAAGVQFLNDHSFEELFPLLNLQDSTSALRAVERSLHQAADETAFLYWYGAHPNLISRTLDWAWDRQRGADVYRQRAPARQLARHMLADTARQLRGTTLGWHWQLAAAATDMPEPDFTCQPMRPLDVGFAFLHDLRAQGKTDVANLRRYFKMQYNLDLPAAPAKLARRTVMIYDRHHGTELSTQVLDTARQLHAAGCKVAVMTHGPNRLSHREGIPIIETASHQVADAVLHAILPVDTVVWIQPPSDLAAYPAKRHHIQTNPVEQASSIVEPILDNAPSAPLPRLNHPTTELSNRRKVVFISNSPWAGGAERVTYDLLHGLNRSKYELHFIHLAPWVDPPVPFDPAITIHDLPSEMANLSSLHAPLWKRAFRRFFRILGRISDRIATRQDPIAIAQHLAPLVTSIRQVWPEVIALHNILRRIGFDALLIPVMEDATNRVWLAQAFAAQPYCVSLHTAESYAMPPMYPAPERLAMERFLFSNACRSAAAVTFPSPGCREDLARNFQVAEHQIEVMPNPIDLHGVLRSCGDMPEIPLPPLHGKCLFVHAARLSAEKNHRLLLDACFALKQSNPNFLVVCLGEGGERSDIEHQIDALGLREHVLLLGAVQNPFAYFARAQGLLLTSQFEGFAIVLVESLACGALPISVDCPYGPRAVLESGKHGLLVPPDDPVAFAQAMQRVATDRELREQARLRGPAHAAHFEIARIVSQWEALIDRIAAPNDKVSSAVAHAA
jgi:glycosyltransferase involved in cell wall biosynthesis